MRKKETLSFEEGMNRLDAITGALSEGNLSLEESVRLYEEGQKLSDYLEKVLSEHKRKIEMIDTETAECVPFEDEKHDL